MQFKFVNDIKKHMNQNGSRYLLVFLVFYTFIMLGRSVWLNFQLQKQTEMVTGKIAEVKTQNANLENLILYYKTDSFKEVEARAKLGLKKPNEKVMSVPVQKFQDFNQEIESQTSNISQKEDKTQQSNPVLWWQYITK